MLSTPRQKRVIGCTQYLLLPHIAPDLAAVIGFKQPWFLKGSENLLSNKKTVVN